MNSIFIKENGDRPLKNWHLVLPIKLSPGHEQIHELLDRWFAPVTGKATIVLIIHLLYHLVMSNIAMENPL